MGTQNARRIFASVLGKSTRAERISRQCSPLSTIDLIVLRSSGPDRAEFLMSWHAAIWGAVGGSAAALVGLVRQLAISRREVFEEPRRYFLGWSLSLCSQAIHGGLVASLVGQAFSAFLTGLTALGLLAFMIYQIPTVRDWEPRR